MKKTLFTSVAMLTLLAAGSAFAADIHGGREDWSMKDGPALMPVARWQGFYAGVNGGYGSADSEIGVTKLDSGFTPSYQSYLPANMSTELSADAFMGGFQIGYNRQSGALVFGIEADYDFGRFEASRDTGVIQGPYPSNHARFQETVTARDFATLRGRLGAAYGNLFVYSTGGLAVSTFEFSRRLDANSNDVFSGPESSEVRLGWTIGGGAEYALDNAWSLKAEYLHADFGTVSNQISSQVFGGGYIDSEASLTMDVIRAGINYKFGARDETLK